MSDKIKILLINKNPILKITDLCDHFCPLRKWNAFQAFFLLFRYIGPKVMILIKVSSRSAYFGVG